ncbi:MAG: hypothetical protein IKZ43_07400 [Acidaminococcaceae bacterium]|nr:hypothetical protein [Acidaminococcaceae bacterium]
MSRTANNAYRLYVTSVKDRMRNVYQTSFPLTQPGLHDAQDAFNKLQEEAAVVELKLFRHDETGLKLLQRFERGK